MKANLWCCYQCDAPTGCIKNSQILSVDKIGCICTSSTRVQLQLEKFFCFFLGGPARAPHNVFFGWARPRSS